MDKGESGAKLRIEDLVDEDLARPRSPRLGSSLPRAIGAGALTPGLSPVQTGSIALRESVRGVRDR